MNLRLLKELVDNNELKAEQTCSFTCYLETVRDKGKLKFFLLRDHLQKIQAVVTVDSPSFEKIETQTPVESFVSVSGTLVRTKFPIKTATIKNFEMKLTSLVCVAVCSANAPFQLRDAVQSDFIRNFSVEKEDELSQWAFVARSLRLDNRVFDLRLAENHAVFSVRSKLLGLFRAFFAQHKFLEMQTPKLLGAASESGASVFKVNYFDRTAFLAQSPQLYKQMCVLAGFPKVFEVGPVFRAEDSNTHKHLTEYTGVDIEMRLEHQEATEKDGLEVAEFVWMAISDVFGKAEQACAEELALLRNSFGDTVGRVKIAERSIIIPYMKAVELINNAKIKEEKNTVKMKVGEDLGSKEEQLLGALVKDEYKSDLFIVSEYPFAVRAFYTKKLDYKFLEEVGHVRSSGFDFFLKGEEIISGAERENSYEQLCKNTVEKGIELEKDHGLQFYLEGFKYGAPRHGGIGMGFDRFVNLFLGYKNVRSTVLFPRDPTRLSP